MNNINHPRRGMPLLEEALSCWHSAADFRRERNRNKDYTFGRQWNDLITVNGRRMTEKEYIISEGNIPLKNNLIRRVVRNVLGVFRSQYDEREATWPEEERKAAAAEGMRELYARTMEEFLISGMAIHKKWVEKSAAGPAAHTSFVSPEAFFYSLPANDFRGDNAELVGEIHDVTSGEWCDAFVRTRADYELCTDRFHHGGTQRVFEIWRREHLPRRLVHDRRHGEIRKVEESEWQRSASLRALPSRWFLDDVWRYYFIDTEGRVLAEGDSPYPDGKHPYVFKGYPMLDGEIHSFVNDIIDQQRYANRLITLYDWTVRASAKGVLLLPEGAVDPENLQEVADQWSRFNGVIVYRAKAGVPDPKQVSGNVANLGITELLDIQLKMLEDVSGVNGALQGNLSNNSVSGTLYNQQTQNALTSLSDILETFWAFIEQSRRLCKLK